MSFNMNTIKKQPFVAYRLGGAMDPIEIYEKINEFYTIAFG